MSAWDDYMKEHGKEEYTAWEGAIKPMTDEIARLQRELEEARMIPDAMDQLQLELGRKNEEIGELWASRQYESERAEKAEARIIRLTDAAYVMHKKVASLQQQIATLTEERDAAQRKLDESKRLIKGIAQALLNKPKGDIYTFVPGTLAPEIAALRERAEKAEATLRDRIADRNLIEADLRLSTLQRENATLREALVDLIDASQDARCADLRVVIDRARAALTPPAQDAKEKA